MLHMDEVGVRDLRLRASELLRDVQAGARYTITDRGRPVAQLVPLDATAEGWQQLVDRGAVRPASDDLAAVLAAHPPLPERSAAGPLSQIVVARRDDERW